MKKSIILLLLVLALVLMMIPCALAEEDALPSPDPADAETEVKDEDDDPYYLALTPANFPDDRFRAIIETHLSSYVTVDDAGVKYVSKKGVLGFKILEMNTPNPVGDINAFYAQYAVTTLKGIELFPNLTKLDCMHRSLPALDLSGNPNLKQVQCSYNNIATLTVSENNTGLTLLDCHDNKLTTLDVSGAVNLASLSCCSNPMTSLTLPNTATLESVNAHDCQLSELTLPGSVSLKSLDLQRNKLSALNVANQTRLYRLKLDGNQFTALTLEHLPALKELTVSINPLATLDLSDLPLLETLECNNCQMPSLTLSNLPALGKVVCMDSHLQTLTFSQLPVLSELDCSNNALTSLDCSPLTNLWKLTCTNNQLTSLTLGQLSKLKYFIANTNKLPGLDLTGCTALVSVQVAYNELTTLDLSHNGSITRLEIAGNRIPYLDMNGHPKTIDIYNIDSFDYNTPHRVSGTGHVSEGTYTFDLKQLVPISKFRVTSVTQGVTIDSNTGIATLPSALDTFRYSYLVKSDGNNSYTMKVEVTVTGYTDLDAQDDPHYLALTEGYIPDANFRAVLTEKLEALGLVQEDGGVKYVSWSNTKKVKTLNLSLEPDGVRWADLMESDPAQYAANLRPYAFASLSGLSYFTELTSVEVRQRSLTSLYLGALSKVTHLDCSYNEITSMGLPLSLVTLDMSHNKLRGVTLEAFTHLTDAQCSYNNMTSLNVPNSIVRFSCANNNLTSLYLGDKTALVEVDCSRNQINNLYLEDNIRLEKLTADGNRIAELNLSKNGALMHLSCADNGLTALKVDMLSALVSLDCSGNQLSALDVSKNTKLRTLRCTGNRLSCLELSANALLPVDDTALQGQRLTTLYLFDNNDHYTCYLGPLVDDTHRVTVTTEGAVYDPDTGAVTFDTEAASVDYLYDTTKGMLAVTAPLDTVVAEPPTITTQPKNVTVKSGSKAKFTVKAKEKGVTFQWYGRSEIDTKWTLLVGETKDTLTVVGSGSTNWWRYRCLVRTKDGGEDYSDTAILTVILAPPVFKTQPKEVTVKSGAKAKFTVKASGKNLHYQWYVNKPGEGWAPLDGETKAELTLLATMDMNCWKFYCNAWNDDGDEDSHQATLLVIPQPASVKTQPKDAKVKSGSAAKFKIGGSGPNLSYQWYVRASVDDEWAEIAGATKADYSFTASMTKNGSQYYCKVWNDDGSADSTPVTLTVTPVPVVIKTHPKSVTVKSESKGKFTVKASGPSLKYQWFTRASEADAWTEIDGATNADYSFTAKLSQNGAQFYCRVWNDDESLNSDSVTLTVTPQPPKFSTQPKDAKVKAGAKATFKTKASGKGVTYQWYYRTSEDGEWILLEGETSASLTVITTEENFGFQYRCRAQNADGEVCSNPAFLLRK